MLEITPALIRATGAFVRYQAEGVLGNATLFIVLDLNGRYAKLRAEYFKGFTLNKGDTCHIEFKTDFLDDSTLEQFTTFTAWAE